MNIIHPVKLAYRGVLIERPCTYCDTVDIHFDGKCNTGPCAYVHTNEITAFADRGGHGLVCGMQRFGKRSELNHDRQYLHEWVANTYYPADIDWSGCSCDIKTPLPTPSCALCLASRGFHKILDCVRREGQPEMYTSDLFRDYQKLVSQSISRFVWKLRANGCGSDLYAPEDMIYDSSRGARYFLYDGLTHGPLGDFVEVNRDTALTVLGIWRTADRAGHPRRMSPAHACYVDAVGRPDGERS